MRYYFLIGMYPDSLILLKHFYVHKLLYWNAAAGKEKVGKGINVSLFIPLVYSRK